ncbi:hypothetical protein GGS20DRAFT_553968 [Poronia punctata]|nr:hypothetical protein GGS20DRAFT_553968 [Poronia punctata]
MAAPASKTIANLSGKWVLNKTLSDPTDPALSLQGLGWILRKGIGAATISITAKQYKDDAGHVHVDIDQTASGLKGTQELRTCDWEPHEHKDWIFGRVDGRTRFLTAEELAALVAGPDAEAIAGKWTNGKYLAEDWLEGETEATGPNGASHILNHVKADNGWFATQVWGFQNIGGERRYTRNVVVAKGDKFENFKMVWDFVSE